MGNEEVPLDQVSDVLIDRVDLVPEILEAVRAAATEISRQGPNFAQPTIQRVNDLLMMASARCGLDPPPPPSIDTVVDDDGSLVYRCRHATPHRWWLNGKPK